MKTKVICWYLIIIIRNWIDELIWFNEEAFHFLSFHLFSVKSWKQNNYKCHLKTCIFHFVPSTSGFQFAREHCLWRFKTIHTIFHCVKSDIIFSICLLVFFLIGLLIFFLFLKRLQCSQSYIFKTIMPDHE